jgi:hypothetical protein
MIGFRKAAEGKAQGKEEGSKIVRAASAPVVVPRLVNPE